MAGGLRLAVPSCKLRSKSVTSNIFPEIRILYSGGALGEGASEPLLPHQDQRFVVLDSYSIPVEFTLPDCSDVASIGEYGLQRLNAIIGAYEAFLGQVRGTYDLSFHLVLDLLAVETHQRADLEAALAQRS